MKNNERSYNLDVIRIFSFFTVVSVHFFKYTNFYTAQFNSPNMYLQSVIRMLSMCCIPLYLILSGYLLSGKTLETINYSKLHKIIWTYIFSTLFCIVFDFFVSKNDYTLFTIVSALLQFHFYSWYVEMYIGLFILSPYLNIMYYESKSKINKKKLLFIFILLTSLPSLINLKFQILPTFFNSLYYFTYYFIGVYISEFYLDFTKIKKHYYIIFLFITNLLLLLLNIYASVNKTFIQGDYTTYRSIFVLLNSTIIFLLFQSYNFRFSLRIKKVIQILSRATFSAYLVSYVFDTLVYYWLNSWLITDVSITNFISAYLLCVGIVFFISLFVGSFIDLCINILSNQVVKLRTFIDRNRN